MPTLLPADTADAILPAYRGTAIERLLQYHNLGHPLPSTTGHAELLVVMCMDHRKDLVLPNEFAYVIRSAGGHTENLAFDVSYAIAVGGVSTIALLAHTDCGMAHIATKRKAFIAGLCTRAGWSPEAAAAHFDHHAPAYRIEDPVAFVCAEATRLRQQYSGVLVAPLLYHVETDRLAQVLASEETR